MPECLRPQIIGAKSHLLEVLEVEVEHRCLADWKEIKHGGMALAASSMPWQLAVPQDSNKHAQSIAGLCREAAEEEPRKQSGSTDNSNALENCGGGGKRWSRHWRRNSGPTTLPC